MFTEVLHFFIFVLIYSKFILKHLRYRHKTLSSIFSCRDISLFQCFNLFQISRKVISKKNSVKIPRRFTYFPTFFHSAGVRARNHWNFCSFEFSIKRIFELTNAEKIPKQKLSASWLHGSSWRSQSLVPEILCRLQLYLCGSLSQRWKRVV